MLIVSLALSAHLFLLAKPMTINVGEQKVHLDTVLQNQGIIWSIALVSADKLIFTTKKGQIKSYDIKTNQLIELQNPPKSDVRGQGGLLDIKQNPVDPQSFFATYTKKQKNGYTTALATSKLNGNSFSKWTEIFVAQPASSSRLHFGSRIAFDDKQKIYMSIGDRGERDLAQDLNTHMGKIIRLNLDGTIPKDNPFAGKVKHQSEIYSYGHRNPQGLTFVKNSKQLFAIEHGPRGGDELNLIKKGANYGWPIVSHGREYFSGLRVSSKTEQKGVESPLKVYIPSIAPCGLDFYPYNAIKAFENSFLTGSLVLTHLNQIIWQNQKIVDEKRHLKSLGQRIRSVLVAPNGDVFFSSDEGSIYKLHPKKVVANISK